MTAQTHETDSFETDVFIESPVLEKSKRTPSLRQRLANLVLLRFAHSVREDVAAMSSEYRTAAREDKAFKVQGLAQRPIFMTTNGNVPSAAGLTNDKYGYTSYMTLSSEEDPKLLNRRLPGGRVTPSVLGRAARDQMEQVPPAAQQEVMPSYADPANAPVMEDGVLGLQNVYHAPPVEVSEPIANIAPDGVLRAPAPVHDRHHPMQ